MDLGASRSTSLVMPALSNWNTPCVSPAQSILLTASSSRGILSKSTVSPVLSFIKCTASSMTVRVRRPRKSIFRRPSSSTWFLSNWVVIIRSWLMPASMSAASSSCRGTSSISGFGAITTPAAWVPLLRGRPSTLLAMSIMRFTSGSLSYMARRSLVCSALSRVIPSSRGTALATRSVFGRLMPRARPTSRTAARACNVPKVMISDTWSAPYLRIT